MPDDGVITVIKTAAFVCGSSIAFIALRGLISPTISISIPFHGTVYFGITVLPWTKFEHTFTIFKGPVRLVLIGGALGLVGLVGAYGIFYAAYRWQKRRRVRYY